MRISYDARGLAEPVAQPPRVATIEDGPDGPAATFDAADLPFPKTGRYRIRRVQLIDNVSGRITRRPLGTLAATAGVRGATVVTVARGQTGSYTLTSQGIIGERIPKTGVIVSKPEPVTT